MAASSSPLNWFLRPAELRIDASLPITCSDQQVHSTEA